MKLVLQKPTRAFFEDPVTLTRHFFQTWRVQNRDGASPSTDESGFLKKPSRYRHAGAASAEKTCDQVMRQHKRVRLCAVSCDKQPAAQSLLQGVVTVANARLCNLNQERVRISEKHFLQRLVLSKFFSKQTPLHAISSAAHLNDCSI